MEVKTEVLEYGSKFALKINGCRYYKRCTLEECTALLKGQDNIRVKAPYMITKSDNSRYQNVFTLHCEDFLIELHFRDSLYPEQVELLNCLNNVICSPACYCNIIVSGAEQFAPKDFICSRTGVLFPSYCYNTLIKFIEDNLHSYISFLEKCKKQSNKFINKHFYYKLVETFALIMSVELEGKSLNINAVKGLDYLKNPVTDKYIVRFSFNSFMFKCLLNNPKFSSYKKLGDYNVLFNYYSTLPHFFHNILKTDFNFNVKSLPIERLDMYSANLPRFKRLLVKESDGEPINFVDVAIDGMKRLAALEPSCSLVYMNDYEEFVYVVPFSTRLSSFLDSAFSCFSYMNSISECTVSFGKSYAECIDYETACLRNDIVMNKSLCLDNRSKIDSFFKGLGGSSIF